MAYSLVHTGIRLLPLLAALLLPPLAQADRPHYREHQRLQQHGQPWGQYRNQGSYRHNKHGYRHRDERRHKAFRQHQVRRFDRHSSRRLRVVEPYYYSPPHVQYRSRVSRGAGVSVILPLGSLIRELPGGSISLYFNGHPYYYHGGNYYRSHRHGYRVVAPPGRSHRQ